MKVKQVMRGFDVNFTDNEFNVLQAILYYVLNREATLDSMTSEAKRITIDMYNQVEKNYIIKIDVWGD